MADDKLKATFDFIEKQVVDMEAQIKRAKSLIAFSKRAGMDVSAQEKNLSNMELKLKQYQIALAEQKTGIYDV